MTMNKSQIIDELWRQGFFESYRKVKDISDKIWKDYKVIAGNISTTLKLKNYLTKDKKGWCQKYPSDRDLEIRSNHMGEVESILGQNFRQEMHELKISLSYQPISAAFLMRKILEKVLFIVISKSDFKSNVEDYKKNNSNRLPGMNDLLGWAKNAQVDGFSVCTPKNVEHVERSKYLGDTAAHNYFASPSFDDLNPEIPYWKILVKELSRHLP